MEERQFNTWKTIRQSFPASKSGETLLYQVLASPNLEKVPDVENCLQTLFEISSVNVQKYVNGDLPLLAFVRNAKTCSAKFIQMVISLFVQYLADLNLLGVSGTALDVAIQNQSITLVAILVNYGARTFKDAQATDVAVQFLCVNNTDARVAEIIDSLSLLNPLFRFKYALSLISTDKPDRDHTVMIEGVDQGKRYLNRDSMLQLFDEKYQTFKTSSDLTIKCNGQSLFRVVCNPAVNDKLVAQSLLHQQFGSYTSPICEVFQCTSNSGEKFPILLSNVAKGKPLSDLADSEIICDAVMQKADRYNLTELFFILCLLEPSTNHLFFAATAIRDQVRYLFNSVLNENAFQIQTNPDFDYLKPLSDTPLDGLAKSQLSQSKIDDLKQWLLNLSHYEARMNELFGETYKSSFYLSGPGSIKKIYIRLTAICEAFSKNATNPQFTGGDLLRCIQPALLQKKTVEQPANSPRKGFGMRAQSTPPKVIKYTPNDALNELGDITNAADLIRRAKLEIKVNMFEKFILLTLDSHKQEVVNSLQWELLDDSGIARSIIKSISRTNLAFTHLDLKNCKVLTDEILVEILKNSPNLRYINLAGCTSLSDKVFKIIATHCYMIEELILDKTNFRSLPCQDFFNLQVLSAAGCENLTDAKVNAKMSKSLSFAQSKKLTSLVLTEIAPKLTNLNVDGCTHLDAKSLSDVLFSAPKLQNFQHLSVPEFDITGYAINVLQQKVISADCAKSLIHANTLNLQRSGSTEQQFQQIIALLSQPDEEINSQIIKKINITGCQISLKAIAFAISKLSALDSIICQFGTRTKEFPLLFPESLPASLKVTNDSPTSLNINYDAAFSEVEGLALKQFREFLNEFFGANKLKVVTKGNNIIISDIPLTDLAVYLQMFQTFMARAHAHHQIIAAMHTTQKSPRNLYSKPMRPSSSMSSDLDILDEPDNLVENSFLIESTFYRACFKLFELTIHHGFSQKDDNKKNPTLAQLLNPETTTAPITAKPLRRATSNSNFQRVSYASSTDDEGESYSASITDDDDGSEQDTVEIQEKVQQYQKRAAKAERRGKSTGKFLQKVSKYTNKLAQHFSKNKPSKEKSVTQSKFSSEDEDEKPFATRPLAPLFAPTKIEDEQNPSVPINFEDPLDACSLDEFTLMSMLTCSSNDLTNLQIVTVEQDGKTIRRLENIGFSQCFVKAMVNDALMLCNPIFLFDSMRNPVNETARQKILSLKLDNFDKWFEILKKLRISLPKGCAEDLVERFILMQQALKKNPLITKLEVLGILFGPAVMEIYSNALGIPEIKARFNSLSKNKVMKIETIDPNEQETNFIVIKDHIEHANSIRENLLQGKKVPVPNIRMCQEAVINETNFELETNNDALLYATKLYIKNSAFKPEKLILRSCMISEKDLLDFFIKNVRNLTYLDLSGCPAVSDNIFSHVLTYCPHVHTLILRNTEIATVNTIYKGKYLDLSGTQVDDNIFADITINCSSLNSLILTECKQVTHLPYDLNVKHLDLSDCNINESIFKALSKNCRFLQHLRIKADKITHINYGEAKYLKTLDVSGSKNLRIITSESTSQIKSNLQVLLADDCQQLQSISLDEADKLAVLQANRTRLVEVHISNGRNLHALKVVEIDDNTHLKIFNVRAVKLVRFKAANCHNLNSSLSKTFSDHLQQDLPTSSSLLLRVTPDVITQYGPALFKRAQITNSNWSYANLAGADFTEATCTNVNLSGADLSRTKFLRADLTGANLGQGPLLAEQDTGICTLTHTGDLFAFADGMGSVTLCKSDEVLRIFNQKKNKSEAILAIAISHDGQKLAVAGNAQAPKLKDPAATINVCANLQAINPEEGEIISLNDVYTVTFYDANNLFEPKSCDYAHAEPIFALHFTSDFKLISASEDSIKIRDMITGKAICKFEPQNTSRFKAIAIFPKNLLLAANDDDGYITIYNLINYNKELRLLAHQDGVGCIAFTPDGQYLVTTGEDDNIIKFWNIKNNWQVEKTVRLSYIRCIGFNPENKKTQYMFTADKHTLSIWNFETYELLQKFSLNSEITAIDISEGTIAIQNYDAYIIRTACANGRIHQLYFYNTGIQYELKRSDFDTAFKADGMDITDAKVTKSQAELLKKLGAVGRPLIIAPANTSDAETEDLDEYHICKM